MDEVMGNYAKAIVATVGAILETAQVAFPMSVTAHAWVTVALAGVTAFGVYAIPNQAGPPTRARRTRPPRGVTRSDV